MSLSCSILAKMFMAVQIITFFSTSYFFIGCVCLFYRAENCLETKGKWLEGKSMSGGTRHTQGKTHQGKDCWKGKEKGDLWLRRQMKDGLGSLWRSVPGITNKVEGDKGIRQKAKTAEVSGASYTKAVPQFCRWNLFTLGWKVNSPMPPYLVKSSWLCQDNHRITER